MASIRNLLANSRYTVNVFRPSTQQVAGGGYATPQWQESRGATPVLANVPCIIGQDRTTDEVSALGTVQERMAKMMWLDEDIRELDIVQVQTTDQAGLHGLYFMVKKVNRIEDFFNTETQQTAWLEERKTPFP